MVSRPTSITVIAWYLIGLSILGALGYVAAIFTITPAVPEAYGTNPIPLPIQHVMGIGGFLLELVCGYFILRARNWARYVYVSWSGLHLVIVLLTSQMKLFVMPSVAILAIITFFLFRPGANAFFAAGEENIDPRSFPSTRRMFGILFYLLAGFFFSCTAPMALMPFGAGILKTTMMAVSLLPFAVCLAIGRWLSADENWKRDVGVVFVVSSAWTAAMAIMMARVFANPEFSKKIRPEHADLTSDYLFAAVWLGAWLLLGCALIAMSRNDSKQPKLPLPLAR